MYNFLFESELGMIVVGCGHIKSFYISFPVHQCLSSKHVFGKACLNSGILIAYTTGLTKELERYINKVSSKMWSCMLYPKEPIKLQRDIGIHEIKVKTDTYNKAFVKRCC